MFKGIKIREFCNTTEEFHALIIGIFYPACRLWGIASFIKLKINSPYVHDITLELHYFMAGVFISTVVMIASIVAVIIYLI